MAGNKRKNQEPRMIIAKWINQMASTGAWVEAGTYK